MVAELGSVWPITSAYAFKHAKLPLMYLLVEDENPWLSIYARKKNSAENVYTASGDFVRHSYNILEGRWSYSDGVPGASILRPFFKSITALEHIDATVDQVSRRPQPMTLSQKSDPRLAADSKSDQFGPKIDHYEIPESSLNEHISKIDKEILTWTHRKEEDDSGKPTTLELDTILSADDDVSQWRVRHQLWYAQR